MHLIFEAFEISGVQADARAAIMAGLGLMLIVMAVAYITSVLFGVGHNGRTGGSDDN